MNEEEFQTEENDESYRKFVPLLTLVFCLAGIVLFTGVNLKGIPDTYNDLFYWGAPSYPDIFKGNYWGLITSSFVHIEIWHIAFNLYWFWIFSKKIEFESGKLFFLFIVLSSAQVSSCTQLAISESTGIGLSGIVYALFGYILLRGRSSEKYKGFLRQGVVQLFLIWLPACILLTQMQIMNIANGSHFGGFFWGLILGYISGLRFDRQLMLIIPVISFSFSTIFWSPFSLAKISFDAYELHRQNKLDEAKKCYEEILRRDKFNEFATQNMNMIDLKQLADRAYKAHNSGKYEEARELYRKILAIDPNEIWARENLSKLP